MTILNRCERRFSAAGLALVIVVGLVVTSWLGVAPALGATLYVRASGDDSLNGSTAATALRTITRATVLARAEDEIVVGPGIYPEGDLRPRVFGRVRFFADRRGVSTGDPPGAVVVDATGFTSGFEINGQLRVSIDGFVIYGASIGIYAKSQSHQAVISNNVVSNCGTNGIYVQDSRDVTVFNNLVYNNGRTGILVTGSIEGSPGAVILSNTVYLNVNRGIFFAGTEIGSPGGLVFNNIVRSNGVAGVQVNASSRDGYLSAGNVSFDNRFASGTPIDVTDIDADPLFVDPAGADGLLGGAAYADDSFHLSDQRAGQAVTSAAVDAGTDVARRLSLYRSSTRTDGKYDRRYVDAGYHYDNFDPPPASPSDRIRRRRLYVSASKGSDVNNGGTRSTAVSTVSRALSLARPGHEIRVLSGTYREGEIIISTAMSGKPRRPVVVKGMGNVVLDATGAQRGLTLTSVSELIVEGLAVTGALDNGIEVRNSAALNPDDPRSHSVTLRRCRLFGNGKRGLSIRNSVRVTIEASRFEDNGSRGIQIEASDVSIKQSIARANGATGLWAIAGSTVEITHTDFLDNLEDGVLVEESVLSLTRGTLRGSKEGGARFKRRSIGVLDSVVVVRNLDAGVQVASSSLTLMRSTVCDNRIGVLGTMDPLVQMPNEIAIEGSTVCRSGASGVDVQSTALRLRSTSLSANGAEGLRQAGGSTDIEHCRFQDNRARGASLSDVTSVKAKQVVFSHNDNNGLQIVNAGLVSVAEGTFQENLGDGVTILDSSVQAVTQAHVEGNGGNGIQILRNTNVATPVEMEDNTVSRNGREGVQQNGGALSMGGGRFEENGASGIALSDVTAATITDTLLVANGSDGLQTDHSGVRIENSFVHDNGRSGLSATGGSTVTIDRTDFLDNLSESLLVRASDLGMYGGTLQGSKEGGARFLALSSGELQNVVIVDNQDVGVQVLSSVVSIAGSTIQRNGIGVLADVDAVEKQRSEITIDDSIVCNSGASGVDVQSATVTLLGTIVCSNGADGLRQKGGFVDIDGCAFGDNAARGVSVTDASHLSASDVVAARNGNNGLQASNAGIVDIANCDLFDNRGDGLTVADSSVRSLADTRSYRNGSTGILILRNPSVLPALQVANTRAYENGQEGFRLSGGGVHFEKVAFDDNLSSGVSLTAVDQVSARGVTVARNRSNGFAVATAQSVSLIDAVFMQNTGDGLTILDSPTSEVSNALVAGNGSTGILISGEVVVSPAARVVGSTVYGNVNRGLLLRSTTAMTPSSTKVTVARNVFRHNGNAGIQVNTAPLVDYSGDYNVSTDPYGPQTPVGVHDLLLDPLFVDSAAGNFRLSQQAAGQLVTSPAVDAGGMSALAAGMSTLTTRTDGVADAGIVDIGYHYPLPTL